MSHPARLLWHLGVVAVGSGAVAGILPPDEAPLFQRRAGRPARRLLAPAFAPGAAVPVLSLVTPGVPTPRGISEAQKAEILEPPASALVRGE
jgi:hypothetical protein